ncbi:MAG: hypothetical protein K2V38_11950, partial [Gemmataceae bacterium]|nr:hypothetical protein [Gemmataceae bacterium]
MTEREWNAGADPLRMAEELPPHATRRQLVRFAANVGRLFEGKINRPSARAALDAADAFADGRIDGSALAAAVGAMNTDHSRGHNALKGRNDRDRAGLAVLGLFVAVFGDDLIDGTAFGWAAGREFVRDAVFEAISHLA